MNATVLLVNGLAAIGLLAAAATDGERAVRSVRRGLFAFVRILPIVLVIVVIIGLFLGFVPPETIQRVVGGQTGRLGILLTAVIGSVLHIPSIVAFPLAASFLELGASITITAVFITTLTVIGVVTLPLEIRVLGWRFALLRNGASLVGALIVGVLMGLIL